MGRRHKSKLKSPEGNRKLRYKKVEAIEYDQSDSNSSSDDGYPASKSSSSSSGSSSSSSSSDISAYKDPSCPIPTTRIGNAMNAASPLKSNAQLSGNGGDVGAEEHEFVNLDNLTATASRDAGGVHWNEMVYKVNVERSLVDLARTCRDPKTGEQKPLPIHLNAGIEITQFPATMKERFAMSSRSIDGDEYSKNPAAFSKNNFIVDSVKVSGVNNFPCNLELVLENLQGTPNVVRSSHAVGETHALVIECPARRKFNKETVMKNTYSKSLLEQMQQYPDVTPENLTAGVFDAMPHPKTNRARVFVPHTRDKPHMVVAAILENFKDHPLCTDQMRIEMKRKSFPAEIIKPNEERADYVYVDKELFHEFAAQCTATISKMSARSDVTNPHGFVTRSLARPTFKSSKQLRSASAMDAQEAQPLWDSTEGVRVGLRNDEAQKNALNMIQSAQFFITVRYAPVERVTKTVSTITSASRRR
jgi:hypothetical protein